MRFKIDWASLIVGRKLTVFALFYFVFKGNFPGSTSRRGLYLEGRFNGGFLRYRFGGLIFGILRYFSCAMCTFRRRFSDKKYVGKLSRQ